MHPTTHKKRRRKLLNWTLRDNRRHRGYLMRRRRTLINLVHLALVAVTILIVLALSR